MNTPVFLRILLILLPIFTNAQSNGNIPSLILQHVNELRDSLKLHPLRLDQVLNEAGEDHAYYLSLNGTLTHFQKTYTKETPSERVLYYGGNRTYIGENVAYVTKRLNNGVLDEISVAKALYEAWYNSPKHYENMVDPDFTRMGVGQFVAKEKVYAAQVFSSEEIRLPTAFRNSNLSWGVRPREITCKDDEQVYETMFFANSVEVDGRDIYLKFHDLDFFKNVIHNENDGIAIDVVLREQLPCHKENQFHISEIYDGEMQRPIYRNYLYRKNTSTNPKKIRVKIGEVPAYLGNKQWDANVIIINDNALCDYSVPMCVSSDIYPLLDVETYYEVTSNQHTESPKIRIKDNLHVELLYDRSAGQFSALDHEAFDKLMQVGGLARDIRVECYASVEGHRWFNLRLLEERKKTAEELLSLFQPEELTFKLEENWSLMHRQIKQYQLTDLEGKDEKGIKYTLKSNASSFYDSLLFEQRKTHIYATIDYSLDLDSYYAFEMGAIYDSTLQFNSLPWSKILYEEYIKPELPLEEVVFDSLYTQKELKTNLLAASAIDYNNAHFDSVKVEAFVKEVDRTDSKQLFNYAHFLTRYWFQKHVRSFDVKNVANTISPEELFKLLAFIDTNIVSAENLTRMKVNTLLSGIHYYVSKDEWKLVNAYFDKIVELVKEDYFDAEEARELALFCNHFHKFKQSIELLDPFYDRKELSEDGLFLLAETAQFRKHDLTTERYRAYMNSAKESNLKRYCSWLDTKFQIQRDEYLKMDFCKVCR